jgi:hypothetical protein
MKCAGAIVSQQVRQPRNIRRDPSRLVFGEQLGCRSPALFFLKINIRKRLTVSVAHDKARGLLID